SDKHHGKHERSKHKPASSYGADSQAAHFSFLFVVNELVVDYERGSVPPTMDQWNNVLPPETPSGYSFEIVSSVMRYQGGAVTAAQGYGFYRQQAEDGQTRNEGTVWKNCSETAVCATAYKCWSIFSCNPLLPIVISMEDPLVYNSSWHALQFFHPVAGSPLRGISQAAIDDSSMGFGGGLKKFVAGTNPSWIPALVPKTYSNLYTGSYSLRSNGLAGDLPIVIGLMAFSEPRNPDNSTNRVSEIFLGSAAHRGRWRNGKWTHSSAPAGYPKSTDDNPRGFLVSIYYDPDNLVGSTQDTLESFEWRGIIVHES
ncbi:hypothetical protein S40288_03748, partial [Stachybotrys chartarum IBT 40288]